MSFQITGPGFYRQRNGGKAEVFACRNGWWYGKELGRIGFDGNCWTEQGTVFNCDGERSIVAPWHDPPEPPEGFVIQPREYVAKASVDQVFVNKAWQVVSTYQGHTAAEMDVQFPWTGPHYVASPVPAPFRISDKGCGVYETRDGREATVNKKDAHAQFPWSGEVKDDYSQRWRDDGSHCFMTNCEEDLVRYIGPLPEKWVPTSEFRFDKLQRRWISGMREEWRAVEVTQ